MEEIRELRLTVERHETLRLRCASFVGLYRQWFSRQPEKAMLPRPGDMLRRPEIITAIDQPDDVEIGNDVLAPFRERFPEWAQEWRDSCEQQLRAIVLASPEFNNKLPAGVDPLSLAAVAFDCKVCCRYATNDRLIPPLPPKTLAHDCLTDLCDIWSSKDPVERAIRAAAPHAHDAEMSYAPWSAKSLSVGVWSKRACEIIRAAGKDPVSATREEMDALEVRFWCKTCQEDCQEEKRQVMKWRDAVSAQCPARSSRC